MRVLIVEDDKSQAYLLRRVLSEDGYAIDVATTGEEARVLAAVNQYDGMVLDLQLADNCKAWDMQPDGTYVQRHPAPGEELRCSQDQLMQRALERAGRIGVTAPV